MVKEWRDVNWKSLASKLEEGISESKDGTIAIRTGEIARAIEKTDAPLGAVYWFSFVNLFEEGIVVWAVLDTSKEIVMKFRSKKPTETWQNLYESALEIEKLKDLKTGLEMLLEQFY